MSRADRKSLAHLVAFISWIAWAANVVDDWEKEGLRVAAAAVIAHVGASMIEEAIQAQIARA